MKLTTQELEQMRSVDIGAVAAESLPDVSGMTFDNALSRKERISRFLQTVKNPWVIKLCSELISSGKPILPWKTCTRLDCIDEELITLMGKAGCTRISVGVESISPDIQKRIKKRQIWKN